MANLEDMLNTGVINQDQYNKYKQVNPGLAPIDNTKPVNIQGYDATRVAYNGNSGVGSDGVPNSIRLNPEPVNINNGGTGGITQALPTIPVASGADQARKTLADYNAGKINLPDDEVKRLDALDRGQPATSHPGITAKGQEVLNNSVQSADDKLMTKYADANRDALAAGTQLPYPDIKPSNPVAATVSPATLPETTVAAKAPVKAGSGGAGTQANPLQTGLEKNLDTYKTSLMGKEGDSHNLSPDEQDRLDKIDAWESSGGDHNKAEMLRDAVRKGAVARTKVTGLFEKQETNIKDQTNLEAKYQTDVANQAKQTNDDLAVLDAQNNAAALQEKDRLNKQNEEIHNFTKTQPNYNEDANRYWNNMGTGNKIGFGIGALIAGAAAGFNGKHSNAFDQLNLQIDRDINAQRKTYEAANDKFKTKLSAMGQDYARARELVGDDKNARMLLRAQRLDKSIRDLDVLTKTTGSKRVKLASTAALTKLQAEKDKTLFELENNRLGLKYPQTSGTKPAKLSDEEKKVLGLNNQFGTIINDIGKYTNLTDDPWSPETQGLGSRAANTVSDWWSGEGSAFKKLDKPSQDRALKFKNAKATAASLASVMTGQGAMAEGEAARSAALSAKNERELETVVRDMQKVAQAKGIGLGSAVVPTNQSGPTIDPNRK